MATTLPSRTDLMDSKFTQTWYEIRSEATDQILNATVVWALLKAKGCFVTQTGGTQIERTVKYAYGTTKAVDKTDTLDMGEPETHTAAFWRFRQLSSHIQRDAFTDRENQGKFKIRSYIADRTEAAMDALKQQYESDVLRAEVTDESGKNIQSLNDIVPAYANRATGTFGGIARSNSWWQPKYKQLSANPEVNFLSDMKEFYNTVHNNQEPADILLTSKTKYEIYEDFGLDATQIVGNQKMLDLGFETLKFKGKDFTWTPNMSEDVLFLNSKYIEVVYDPTMWFDMTEWKAVPNQTTRVAHILCAMNIISKSLRRHGRLYV